MGIRISVHPRGQLTVNGARLQGNPGCVVWAITSGEDVVTFFSDTTGDVRAVASELAALADVLDAQKVRD